ncbi:phospholipid scramblase-related protein [Aquihabitans sp. McL0605]|uniref:phospholipid scramblase-related protein n=1 Tax=Aquihabitans sp. McL0605 TaxID=3415671 RepID=UPI003CEA2B9F
MTDTESGGHQPNWYPDPMGRHEYRWFDGSIWTDQVSSHGRPSVDPVQAAANVPVRDVKPEKIAQDLVKAGVVQGAAAGGGHLLNEPVLVVNQKAKLIELSNEYAISDQNGNQIGAVRQVGQSTAKKVMRLVTSYDQFMTHKLQVVDHNHQVILQLTRPAKVVKSKVIVQDGTGAEIGQIVQENVIGKIRFGLVVGEQRIGSINGENWRAWNWNIQDATGTEIARITKTFSGLTRAVFTQADNYVVQIHRPLAEPLRSLVVATAVSVDTALKQDARGFN